MVMLFFFCLEALNRENRTIPTWVIYERLLSDLCSEREIVFSLHFSFLLATTSGLHTGLHLMSIPAGFRQDFLPRAQVYPLCIHTVR